MEMVSKALHERFNYGGILKEVISERISYDYIVGKRKRVENCPINLLHFPKQKTDNEMRVYMKQTITDIQVKTRAPKKRNIHSLILGSFAREASAARNPPTTTKSPTSFSDEASRGTVGHLLQELVQRGNGLLELNPLAGTYSAARTIHF